MSVHCNRTEQNNAPDIRFNRSLDYPRCAAHIDALVFFTQFGRGIDNVQERRHMNDCIHAPHRRSDRHLVSDIANQYFYALREHASCRSIKGEGANSTSCLLKRVDNARPDGAGSAGNENQLNSFRQMDPIVLM
jgi:hypothetical protein